MDTKDRSIDSSAYVQGHRAQVAAYAPQVAERRRGASPLAWLIGGMVALILCGAAAVAIWFVGVGGIFSNISSVAVGKTRTESQSVPLRSAGAVAVNVNMGQGTLTLTGGAAGTSLLDADFTYNVDAWKPIVTYSESGGQGTLSIEQTRSVGFIRTPDDALNEWNLRLKDGIPLTLTGNLGAGSTTVKLGSLSASKLDLSTGAGEVTLDLTGERKQDLNVMVQAGVGDTTLRLPDDVGVRLKVESGVSNVDAGGLNHDGNYYTNSKYGSAPITLEITIKSGAGNVKVNIEK